MWLEYLNVLEYMIRLLKQQGKIRERVYMPQVD